MASTYATLLRTLYLHTEFKYAQPPTAEFVKPSADTPSGLFWTADFAQNTYIKWIIPFLPANATRKCKEIANPWAWQDPNYQWEWSWDAETGTLKDANGESIAFPQLPISDSREKLDDLVGRGFMTKKLVLENGSDPKAQALLGGQSFDFGEEAKKAAEQIP